MTYTVLKEFKIRGTVQPVGSVLQLSEQSAIQVKDYVQPVGRADNASPDWQPELKAWLVGDSLHTTGVCDDLAVEIVKLTTDNLHLQKKLLSLHVGTFRNPCWKSTARKFVQRAAELFDGGLGVHESNYQAANEMHLLSFTEELGITLY